MNGSLLEIGENLASNLTKKGITANASDGLTTLVNKINNIGLTPRYYADWETITNTWVEKTNVSGRIIYFSKIAFEEDATLVFKLNQTPNTNNGIMVHFGDYDKSNYGYEIKGGWQITSSNSIIFWNYGSRGNTHNSYQFSSSYTVDDIFSIKLIKSTHQVEWYVNDTLIGYRDFGSNNVMESRLRIDYFTDSQHNQIDWLYVL